jgi:hypothetical protein
MHQDRVTKTGAILIANEKGVYAVHRCFDLVRVASGNPEPDSFADTFVDVECKAIVRAVDGRTTKTKCDSGHVHTSYEDPDFAADEAAWAYHERQYGDDIHEGNSLAHVC